MEVFSTTSWRRIFPFPEMRFNFEQLPPPLVVLEVLCSSKPKSVAYSG